jgi:CRISPR-associated protein Cas5d
MEGGTIFVDYFSKLYCLEIWGDYACFTRPEMKVERVSYDVITPSAARAIFEAIFWKPAIRWNIKKIEILNPIKWVSIRRNEVGAVMGGSEGLYIEEKRQQRAGLFLRDVRYRLYAELEFIPISKRPKTHNPLPEYLIEEEEFKPHNLGKDENPGKYYGIFERRARKGKCFNQPYIGSREFSCSFKLIENPNTESTKPINETRDLGFMLYDMDFSNPQNPNPDPNNPNPAFFKATIENGVVTVPSWGSKEVRG